VKYIQSSLIYWFFAKHATKWFAILVLLKSTNLISLFHWKSSLKETIDAASTREAMINAEMEHLQQLVPKAKETEINLKERKQRKAQEIEDVPVIKELLRRAKMNSLEFVRQGIPYIKTPWFALGELVYAQVGQLVDVRDINHTWYESTIMSIRG
jgi:phosphoglycerol transferase MdoB-like AlkP superfamily enzyme